VNQEPRDFDKSAFLGKFLDRVTAVAKDSLLPVNECHIAHAGAGVAESIVVGDQSGLIAEAADAASTVLSFAANDNRQFSGSSVVGKCGFFAHDVCSFVNVTLVDRAGS